MDAISLAERKLVTVGPKEELTAAARLMREAHVGMLVVVQPALVPDGVSPVGVLTDRDIVTTVIAREIDPRSMRVEDVMTPKPVTVLAQTPVDQVLEAMRAAGVRRVPVVDNVGRLVGVLSLDDVLTHLAAQLGSVAGSVRTELRAERAART